MNFLKYIFLILISSTLCFCDTDSDDVLDQREEIEDYMDTYYDDYEKLALGVFRYRDTSYSSGDEAEKGDKITYYYAAYTYEEGTLYDTNVSSLIYELVEEGLNTQDWSTDPKEVTIGKTELLEGLTLGLQGCQAGDEVVLVMASDMAYGDKPVGVIPANSSIIYLLSILTVN